MEYITQSADETQNVAYEIANSLDAKREYAAIIALSGDLGAGKTTFVQGLAKAFGVLNRIISPTFILMRQYNSDKGKIYHLDVYRLEKNTSEEIRDLGLEEIIANPNNIVIIEWAEKIRDLLPEHTIWITFEYVSEQERRITIKI